MKDRRTRLRGAGIGAEPNAGSREEPRDWTLPVATSHGEFVAVFSGRGLSRLTFPSGRRLPNDGRSGLVPESVLRWWRLTQRALERLLTGKPAGALPPLDWDCATPFQNRVWAALLRVRAGSTVSYGQLARQLGCPGAARAVGAACGANPVPVLVPCHRVLAANGRLGGFSGGLDWKRRLLAAEGTAVPAKR